MRRLSGLLLAGLLITVTAGPVFGQSDAWKRKWYWGAQSGIFLYSTPGGGSGSAFSTGGHWLITSDRSALFVGLDQIFFGTTTSQVADPSAAGGTRTVTFDSGRRIQAGLLAIPNNSSPQIYVGGGFAIHHITDATPTGVFASAQDQTTAQQRVDGAASKAFVFLLAGFQLRLGNSWALFANYQFMPSSDDFLITSDQHAISGGLRVILSSAHEEVTTER